jgi:putative two-component system response regulator
MIESGIYADTISDWDMDYVFPSAQLHDVGKIAIPDAILNKPGKLTPAEFEILKTHVQIGVDAVKRIIENVPEHVFLRHALHIVGAHHEKCDGSGYPAGIQGLAIPLEGRLMAIVDVYDALVSSRPYKEPLPHQAATKIIVEGAGTHFDPALVGVFGDVEHEFNRIALTH